jgi:tetratricopeptide (TPR) repeat protein
MVAIVVAIAVIALGAVGGGWYWFSKAPMRDFETQIEQKNLVSGSYSAYTVYQRTLSEKGPKASMVVAMGEKASPLLAQKASAFLGTWMRDSEVEETSWEDYVRIREWMNIISPSTENRAQSEYAQGMYLMTAKNQTIEARSHMDQALALKPNWNLALNGLGRVYKNLKDFPTAKVYYERAYSADRTWCFPPFNLGNLYRDNLRDYPLAELFYKEAIQLNPDRPSFHWQLATLYFVQGKAFYPQACEAYRKSLAPPPPGKKGLSPEAEAQARDRIVKCCGS